MTTTKRPQCEEYQMSDEEAAAILAEDPDATLVADYLGRFLNEQEMVAFRERLRTDEAFRRFAEPRIAAWEAYPPIELTSTEEELSAGWQEMQTRLGLVAAMPAGEKVPAGLESVLAEMRALNRETSRDTRLLRLVAGVLFVVGLPAAAAIGYLITHMWRSPATFMRAATDTALVEELPGKNAMRIEPGARVVWEDRPTPMGTHEILLTAGAATFQLNERIAVSYLLITPAGRIRAKRGWFAVRVSPPADVFIRVDSGSVQLDAEGMPDGAGPTTLTVSAGERGRLTWGQSPGKEP